MNMPPKTYKKIKAFMEKLYPGNKKMANEKIKEIENFKDQDNFTNLLYISQNVYIPSSYIMQTLVLKATILD